MCADGKEAFAVVVGSIILDQHLSLRAYRLFGWLYLRASKKRGAKNRGTAPVNIARISREMGGRRGDWSAAYTELVCAGYVIPQGERRTGATHRTLIPSLLTREHDPFYGMEAANG